MVRVSRGHHFFARHALKFVAAVVMKRRSKSAGKKYQGARLEGFALGSVIFYKKGPQSCCRLWADWQYLSRTQNDKSCSTAAVGATEQVV